MKQSNYMAFGINLGAFLKSKGLKLIAVRQVYVFDSTGVDMNALMQKFESGGESAVDEIDVRVFTKAVCDLDGKN